MSDLNANNLNYIFRMNQKKGKVKQDDIQEMLSGDTSQPIKSQYLIKYESQLRSTRPTELPKTQIFSQNSIQHNEYTFERFSYDAERVVPAFEYYKLHVKIGHFSFTANVLVEYCANPLANNQSVLGKYGTAYFSKLNNKSICLKSTSYNREQFHQTFPRVIKEWCILKICSLLKCAPRVDPYLGFDVIVYNDCIQYVMQRGRPIEKMKTEYTNILKEKLRMMHELNIVHCDIKPENIVMSQELGEPLFIDFGMSEIIKESCGFKTFCAFRGTPNYCSPEMMSIIGNGSAFIDLYYNDLCGLEMSIQKGSFMSQAEEMSEEGQIYPQQDSQQNIFYLYAFQFHYLEQNQLLASQQLDRYLLAKGSIKLALRFIKKMANYIFLPSILKKITSLSSFLTNQYSEIDDEIRKSTEIYFSKMHVFWSKFVSSDHSQGTKNGLQILSYEQSKDKYLHLGNDHQFYFGFLLNTSMFQPENIFQYLQIAFSCIKFDVRNLSLSDKAAIAIKINKLILQHRNGQHQHFHLQAKPNSDLDQVRLLIMLILEECIRTEPIDKWAKDSIFDIFQQAIMLDIDLSPCIGPFISFVNRNFRSITDSALAFLELLRMDQALRMVLTDHFESVQIVKIQLCKQIEVLFKWFKARSKQANNQQIKMIRKIVEQYQSDSWYQNSAGYLNFKNDVIFQMIGEMWRMINSLDFFSTIKITILILQSTSRFGDIKGYSDQICKIVNCQEVFQRLNLDFGNLQNPARTKYYCNNLQKFAKQFKKVCSLYSQSYIYLRQFILQNHKGGNMNNHETQKWFIHMYEPFCQESVQKSNALDERQAGSYWIATNLFEIKWFYNKLSTQTQGLFLRQLNNLEAKLQQPLNNLQSFQRRQLLLFQKCLFLYQLYYNQGKMLECLEYLETIILISKRLRIKRLALEFMKQHSLITNSLSDEKRIIQSTMQLFHFCLHEQINFSSFYLQPTNFKLSFILFAVLARNQPAKLCQLLTNFIDFMHQHPVQSYFASLFTIIIRFLQKDPSFGYVIHIKNFLLDHISRPQNPYMLIYTAFSLKSEDGESQKSLLKAIAINIDRVIWFVKKTILRQYFIIFMKMLQQKSLRQQMGNFRLAKLYLPSNERKRICKQLFKYGLRKLRKIDNIQVKMRKHILQWRDF